MSDRICKVCSRPLPLSKFEATPKGYRRRTCASCRERSKRDPTRRNAWQRRHRLENPALYIVRDTRASDTKRGFGGNDLETGVVEELIAEGCSYCGASDLRMTLDRIDNDKSHQQANVVPCCIRCNLLRGSMPYVAWQLLVPSVRRAYELGLFGEWRSQPISRRATVVGTVEGSIPS